MKLFTDANTYLAFFGIDSNLSSLKELKKLLNDKDSKLELILTQQLLDEYERNIGSRMEQSRENIIKKVLKIKIEQPSYIQEKIEDDVQKILEKVEILKEEKLKDLEKNFSEAEKITEEIFSLATIIPTTTDIIEKAKERWNKGNPPRKKEGADPSYGDAINWESMLATLAEDLVIVSNDPDYAEPKKGEKVINRFLEKEWGKKGKGIALYPQLGIFINTLEKKPVISKEALEKEISSSDVFSIEKPLGYRIVTEERVFPLSVAGTNASVFATMSGITGHVIKAIADEDAYVLSTASTIGLKRPLNHISILGETSVGTISREATRLSDILSVTHTKDLTIKTLDHLNITDLSPKVANPLHIKINPEEDGSKMGI